MTEDITLEDITLPEALAFIYWRDGAEGLREPLWSTF